MYLSIHNLFIVVFFFLDFEVGKICTQVLVTKSGAHYTLDETDFFEKKMINKRKKWILDGLDPDEEEKKYLNKRRKKSNKKRKLKKNDKNVGSDQKECESEAVNKS